MPKANRRRQINTEIATIRNNHLMHGGTYAYGGNGRIEPRDSVYIEKGYTQGYEVLRDVMRDPHTFAVLQKRWLSVAEREWEVRPASESRKDKKIADFVTAKLEAIATYDGEIDGKELVPNVYGGFDQICYNLLKAELYGFQPAEIIWGRKGDEVYIKQVKDKCPARFVYLGGDKGYRFRLLTNENMWEGIPLPRNKFIIHTFHPEDDNPYGWGMGGRLFYAVLFKRKLAEFSLTYAEKFGCPTGKALYPVDRSDLKDVLLEAMANMAQESGIALPQGCEFEWMSISGQGTDLYVNLMDYYDREISKTVLGETGSTDQQGAGGSRARDQVGNEVRLEITKGASDLLSSTLNRSLITPLVRFNFGNKVAIPGVWRKFPELDAKEDLNGRAQRDSTISTFMGLKPTRRYIEEIYQIELEEKSEDEQKQEGFNSELGSIFGNSEEPAAKEQPETETEAETEEEPAAEEGGEETEFSEPVNFASAKKIIKWNGIDIGVEYFPGDRRHNKTLKSGYGHIRGTIGADGMALDVYYHKDLPNPDIKTPAKLYKVTQLDKNGNFDEHKYMAGYATNKKATDAYLAQMPQSFFGGIKKVSIASLNDFRTPVKNDAALKDTATHNRFAQQSVTKVLPVVDKWRSQINDEVQRINQLDLDDVSKFRQLEDSLLSLYSEMDSDEYAEILGEAIAASEIAGRYDVSKSK